MRAELPPFRKVNRGYASRIIHSVLTGARGPALLRLIEYDDHHFRAIFAASYFQLAADRSAPSKSQWNTLKKKLKRRNRSIFVFRRYGEIDCSQVKLKGQVCLYLDFGFLPN